MKTIKLCRDCGKPLAPDTLLGLCPECMMKAGLPSSAKATIAVSLDAFVEGPETETKEFVPGTKLGYIGDYELLEEIARGGMGVVYKARQSSLKRIVAIKMIRSGELADEREVQRFRTEAEAAAQLQHPNIVAIHEIGEHEGKHYFSMDFVEGKNLAQIADGKPVTAQSAAEWLMAIAGAVQYAHQRGVLHRDLKPQNIMLDAEGRARVTDFGLAKNLTGDSTLTQTGAVMGSPSYMSPEQARGRNDLVGPASDVYSLGAILYELLTGRPPFRGKSPMETLSQVVNDEPPRPRAVNPNAPVDLETICLKCLEKEPVRRYPTARELEADLGRFLDDEPVLAQPASALRQTMSWFRRHQWVFSAAVSVLALTLLGLAYGLWEQTRYLTWLNAHPDFVKEPGPRTAALGFIIGRFVIGFFLVFAPIFNVVYRKIALGAPWGKIFTPQVYPPPLGIAAAFAAIAVAGMACSLVLAARAIQVFVWEGEIPTPVVCLAACVFPMFVYFLGILLDVVRQQRRILIEPIPVAKPAPLSPEQLAQIHDAIFADRRVEAAALFRAATGRSKHSNVLAEILRMEEELMKAHPERFSAEALSRPKIDMERSAEYGNWLKLGIILVIGLWMLLLPHRSLWEMLFLLMGLCLGGFIRSMSANKMAGWKRAYRGMRRAIKFAAWFLVACFALSVAGFALALFGLIRHPLATQSPQQVMLAYFSCGIVAGWLLVHLSQKKRKAP